MRFARLLVLAAAFAPTTALAQVELTGTYITYVDVGSGGEMLNGSRSMQYQEATTGPLSCDLYSPGVPDEGFIFHATSTTGALDAQNVVSGGAFATTSGPTVVGRTITWGGTYTSGTNVVHIDETFSYELDDRAVKLDIVVTNMGSTALTDVYYLRSGDPDQASGCSGLGSVGPSTDNDVLRQPPTDEGAIVTAGAGTRTIPGGYLVVGMGAHDARARATSNGGLIYTDAVMAWNSPVDPGGVNGDQSISLAFKEPSLAAGASTTFEMFWVWGTDTATVLTRFDDAGGSPCSGAAGSACTSSGGAAGTCHAMRCCVGCWDGTRCHGPGTSTACGIGGGSCIDCTDTDPCTADTCGRTTGTCSHPPAPGVPCDDGLFCTATDMCSATGVCVGAGAPCDDGNPCTAEACSESMHTCSGHTPLPDGAACTAFPAGICHAGNCCSGCWDGTACQPGTTAASCGIAGAACASCVDGQQCTDDVCSAGTCSNPNSGTGTACSDGLYCTTGDHCDGANHCTSGGATPCDDGSTCTADACDESTHGCSHTAATGICAIFGSCFPDGTVNPSNPCQVCDSTRSGTAWSPQVVGAACGTASCSAAMLTPAPTCTAAGTCVPGTRMPCPGGTCASATMCASTCAMDSDCGSTGYCDMTTGMCTPRLTPGADCDRTMECATGVCSADHHCCVAACGAACESCAIPGNLGRCLPVPAGTDPDGECPAGETCSSAGACAAPATDAGVARDAGGGVDAGGTDAATATDASATLDASTPHDAGTHPHASGGCCGVAGTGDRDGAFLFAGLGLALALTRRRRGR